MVSAYVVNAGRYFINLSITENIWINLVFWSVIFFNDNIYTVFLMSVDEVLSGFIFLIMPQLNL